MRQSSARWRWRLLCGAEEGSKIIQNAKSLSGFREAFFIWVLIEGSFFLKKG